jgi:very-short-patch-repair endonuclease
MTRSESVLLARAFRRHMTPPEIRLWIHLRGKRLQGLKFRRQHPLGPFIIDFYCAEAKLAVEVDGQGHAHPDRIDHDRRRTLWLHKHGVRVVRLAAEDVRSNLDGVLEFLARTALDRRAI